MKSGIASKMGLANWPKPQTMVPFMVTPPTTLMTISAAPKQNGNGTPMVNVSIKPAAKAELFQPWRAFVDELSTCM